MTIKKAQTFREYDSDGTSFIGCIDAVKREFYEGDLRYWLTIRKEQSTVVLYFDEDRWKKFLDSMTALTYAEVECLPNPPKDAP